MNSNRCVFCNSSNTEFTGLEAVEGEEPYRLYLCHDCGGEYVDVFDEHPDADSTLDSGAESVL